MSLARSVPAAITALVILFLLAPLIIVIGSAFSATGYMTFPPGTPSLRWFEAFARNPEWLAVLLATVALSLLAACCSVVLGFMAALVSVRKLTRGRSILEFAVLLPLVFPHAALAIAILSVVSTFSLVGTFTGVLLAHVMVTLPFAFRPIQASLLKLDVALEEAALSLGAHPWTTFRRVTLPLLKPGLITAILFCFIISFDEVTVTMFLVGPDFTTLPLKIFSQLQDNASPLVAAVSTVLIATTAVLVLTVNATFGLQLFVDAERGR